MNYFFKSFCEWVLALIIVVLLIGGIAKMALVVDAYNPNFQNELTDIIIGESVDYEFFVRLKDYSLADLTGKLANFKVKRSASDAAFKISKACEINMYFTHAGITGSLSIDDAITGATSGATGVIQNIVDKNDKKYITIDVSAGTFSNGEQIYETEDVNYVTVNSTGINAAVYVSLTPDETTYILGVEGNGNLQATDYVAYVQITNVGGTYNKYALKSNLKLTY